MILQLRIDERLIHGQITTAWSKALDVSAIVVANDAAAGDKLASKVLLMTAPPGRKVVVKTIADTIKLLKDPRSESMKILVIADNPADAITLVNELKIREVNVANYVKKKAPGKVQITPNCHATPEDLKLFEALCETDAVVYSQMIPTVAKGNFPELLKKAMN